MSQLAVTPTFIDTILEACRQVQNGRAHRDVALHAVTEMGELAQEVQIATGLARGKAPGEDGIAGEALDLILCTVDFLYQLDNRVSDRSLMEAINAREAAKGVSYASFCLHGWSGRRPIEREAMADRVMSMADDLGTLCKVGEAPFSDEVYDATYPASRIISVCLHLIDAENPGTTEADLIRLSRRKLDKWMASARPGVEEVA